MPLSKSAALNKDRSNAKATTLEHRHFAVIAGILASLPNAQQRSDVAHHFAAELSQTHPKFNVSRFLVACGLPNDLFVDEDY